MKENPANTVPLCNVFVEIYKIRKNQLTSNFKIPKAKKQKFVLTIFQTSK